jgi:outer membrane autotransporter protein
LIAGGSGNGGTANAITFTGGSNLLNLNPGTQGTLTGNIAVTGSLTFNSSNAATLSNVITGSGAIAQSGTGTLTLAGTNTYTGGTSVTGGTLAVSGAGTLGAIANAISVSGGTLDLGTITQIQNGGLTLTGGTIQNGTLESSGAFAVQAGTISATLAGTGGLTKTGGDVVTLSGTNTYTGATNVNAGTLTANGSIATSTLTTVNAGGTLNGTGTVGALTVNGGTFAPGSIGATGTMLVSGNLVFQNGAVYRVQVNPTTASSTTVTGSATLTGGYVSAQFAPGSYVVKSYDILRSGGLGNTQFTTVSGAPSGFSTALSYTATDVMLNLVAQLGSSGSGSSGGSGSGSGSSSGSGSTPGSGDINGHLPANPQNVATAINNFFNAGGALPPGFLPLFSLTGNNLSNALSQLAGQTATGAQTAANQLMSSFLGLLADPFTHGGFGGLVGGAGGANGFAPEDEDDKELPLELTNAYATVRKAPPAPALTPFEQRWSTWGTGYGGYNRTDGDPATGSNNLTATTGGFAAGADYGVSPFATLGFALAGGGTDWSLAQGFGSGQSQAFQAGAYAAVRSGPVYLTASFAFAEHWMSTNRTSLAGDQLTAKFNAQSYGGRVEAGYRIGTPAFAVTPYAATQWQAFMTPAFAETDLTGGGFGLAYAARTALDARAEVGSRFETIIAASESSVVAFRGKLGYAHDWANDPQLAAVFQALPGASFVVNGAALPHDSGIASAGIEWRFLNGLAFGAKFDGEFAARSQTYAGTATVRYTW